ncbi:MAG: hypothetical protein WC516_08325 [Patescibacteria group bacterium]
MAITREVIAGQTIALEIEIRDVMGNDIDPDAIPNVSIIDSHNSVIRPLSPINVSKLSIGKYRFNYTTSPLASLGIWIDRWQVVVSGETTNVDLSFNVLDHTAAISYAGAQIGDNPNVSYSEDEIIGINMLLAILKARLKNNLQVETIDAYGNIEYVDCNVFTNDELVWFLNCSLQEFNQTPHFTDFHFSNEVIYNRYCHVIVEGACILAWAAQMLIEAGREFTITDNGITMNPPPLSTTLNNEMSQFLNAHRENLKFIKGCIKPSPVGFGSFRVLASNPSWMRLRHLRERRII